MATSKSFTKYLTTLIEEKGGDISDAIGIEGHIGLTYEILIEFVAHQKAHHAAIKRNLVLIDFKNGDIFHFLKHLAYGMIEATGHH